MENSTTAFIGTAGGTSTSDVPQRLLIEYPAGRSRFSDPSARGADGVLRYGNLTPALTELLDRQVHTFADLEAVVEVGGPRLTYRQLWHRASRIAGGLQEQGIGYGDRVAVHMPSGARWVQALLGALLSGAVPVLVHDQLSGGLAEQVLADSGADFVLGARGCGATRAGASAIDGELPDGAAFIDDGAALDDLALLCYTRSPVATDDGSVVPKGVELTNENLLSAIHSMIDALDLSANGLRNLVLLPLAHASGCVDQLLPTFAVGGTVVLAPDSAAWAETIRTEGIDTISAGPSGLRYLLSGMASRRATGNRVDSVARISTAGRHPVVTADAAAVPSSDDRAAMDLSTALQQAFPSARQWSLWGATETSGIGLAIDRTEWTSQETGDDTALGYAFGGTELALCGPRAASGRGELLCRGPSVTPRYWNDPQATADRFTGPWFHTGDQVSIGVDGLVRRAA